MLEWKDLPADATPETVNLPGGRQITFYKVPFPAQGPELRKDRSQRLYLVYMYAHFVFRWYAGESKVSIFHGTIDGRNNMLLAWSINIEERWDRVVLAERGRAWVLEHLARCRK